MPRPKGSGMQDRKQIAFYVPTDFNARIQVAAKADGRSVSDYLRRLVDANLPKPSKS